MDTALEGGQCGPACLKAEHACRYLVAQMESSKRLSTRDGANGVVTTHHILADSAYLLGDLAVMPELAHRHLVARTDMDSRQEVHDASIRHEILAGAAEAAETGSPWRR